MSNPKKMMKVMKKFILSLGLIAMTLGLTNCAQHEDDFSAVEPQSDFALYATVTRTANDGLNTVWSDGDALTVFHAEANADTYVYDAEFTLNDTKTGRFLGSVNGELTAASYDWFAIYPHSKYNSSQTPASTAYTPVGSKKGGLQTQSGNNSTAHIAGENYPLVGVAKGVETTTSPSMEMVNVSSLLEIEVINSLDEPIAISQIEFTAPEKIVGTFHINFADIDEIITTSSGDDYTDFTATLAVEDGEAIAVGESAKFYLAVAPFTAATGKELTIKVAATSETGSGIHEKSITLAEDVTFSAGKIKAVTVDYSTAIKSVEDIVWVENAYNLVPSEAVLSVGDKVVFVAAEYNKAMGKQNSNNRASIDITKNEDNTVDFNTDVTVFTVAEGNIAGTFAFQNGDNYIYAASSGSNHLKEESTLSDNSSWDVSIVNGVATVKAQGENTRNWLRYNNSTQYGNLFSCYSSGQADICIYKLVGEYTPKAPAIVMSISDTTIAYDATEGSVDVAATNAEGWNITATANADWISNLTYADGKITFTLTVNDGEEVREAEVTVTATCEGYEDVTVTFTISQGVEPSGDVVKGAQYSYTFEAKQFSANGSVELGNLTWTLAGTPGGYWGYDATKGQQFGSGGNPYTTMTLSTSDYTDGVEQIVINTSGASSIAATCIVTIGATQIGEEISLTKTATSYTLTSDTLLSGDIVISYTQTSSKAIYIKSITIN